LILAADPRIGNYDMSEEQTPLWRSPCFESELGRILATREKTILPRGDKVVAAVLIPLFRKQGDLHVLLTKRSDAVEHHKGEVSFPGGKLDDDDVDLLHCALRETHEEVGVLPSDVRVVGEMDDFFTVATNYLVVPFVGMIPYPYELKPSAREIDEVLGVPLEVFFDPARRRSEIWTVKGKPVEIIFYKWRGYNIWGATARILRRFTQIVENHRAETAECIPGDHPM